MALVVLFLLVDTCHLFSHQKNNLGYVVYIIVCEYVVLFANFIFSVAYYTCLYIQLMVKNLLEIFNMVTKLFISNIYISFYELSLST